VEYSAKKSFRQRVHEYSNLDLDLATIRIPADTSVHALAHVVGRCKLKPCEASVENALRWFSSLETYIW